MHLIKLGNTFDVVYQKSLLSGHPLLDTLCSRTNEADRGHWYLRSTYYRALGLASQLC
jgi:hypothetical protein